MSTFADRGTWKPGDLVRVEEPEIVTLSDQCVSCKHFLGLLQCEAFPDRIPQEILTGEHDHSKAYPGDNGIRFEAVEPPPLDEPEDIVTRAELRDLSDDELVALITERGGMREDRARHALTIIRGGPPEGVTY